MSELSVPSYSAEDLEVGIVHFGVGNFHRSHQAMYLDRLFESGVDRDWALCGVGLLPGDAAMHDDLSAQGFRYTLVEKDGGSVVAARQIGSIADMLFAPDDPVAVLERLAAPTTRIVTLTITEGGYDPEPGPDRTVFDYLVESLLLRRRRAIPAFAIVSCDNIQGNGAVARAAVLAAARQHGNGAVDWIAEHVSFPSSVVDRITPVTTDDDRALVRERFGAADRRPVVAESFVQWVLEDDFPRGRPALELVGVQLVPDVAPYERMKLRLLNAVHQALTYPALLGGLQFVHEAVTDASFARFASKFASHEAQPTVGDVPGIDLDHYRQTVMQRFANTAIADTLVRLATDGADRIGRFVLPIVDDRDESSLAGFVVAAFIAVSADAELSARIPDRSRDRLDRAVGRLERGGVEAFLDDPVLFGRPVGSVAFRLDVASWYEQITRLGVREALDVAIR